MSPICVSRAYNVPGRTKIFGAESTEQHPTLRIAYLGVEHAENEAREDLRLVRAEFLVDADHGLEADWEGSVTRAGHVLDL
jgi:hypothetical protein